MTAEPISSQPDAVRIAVHRSGPARLQEYTVARIRPMKVLDALLAIQREVDPTLAFRFSCRVAMCGTCTVRMNGRAVLACQAEIPEGGGPVHVEPLAGLPALRDLVVDAAPFFAQWQAVTPYFVPRAGLTPPARIGPGSGAGADRPAAGLHNLRCLLVLVRRRRGRAGLPRARRAEPCLVLVADSRHVPAAGPGGRGRRHRPLPLHVWLYRGLPQGPRSGRGDPRPAPQPVPPLPPPLVDVPRPPTSAEIPARPAASPSQHHDER